MGKCRRAYGGRGRAEGAFCGARLILVRPGSSFLFSLQLLMLLGQSCNYHKCCNGVLRLNGLALKKGPRRA